MLITLTKTEARSLRPLLKWVTITVPHKFTKDLMTRAMSGSELSAELAATANKKPKHKV